MSANLSHLPAHLPEGRPGRILALAITVLLVLIAWFLVSGLLGFHAREETSIADQKDILAHTQALVDTIPALKERYEDAAHNARGDSPLLAESSRETALARLQEIVHDAARGVQVEPASMEPLPIAHSGPFEHLGVRISFTTNWNALVKLLDTLSASTTPHLLVDDIQVQAAGTSAADEATQGRTIDASMTILALRDSRSDAKNAAGRSNTADTTGQQ
ncbi:type II secretion system protein GspM [Acetobacter sp.]|uniref:type II secretion system protein GspM n=1 Tax=Acetobacter sp. TaxID=440 RepID=UPI0025C7083C|nr:type II secretion system protein GspM [Acetobacter sp.]MCH4090561.1 type II secretion system protein GspM [Acetobacter sp.]MCI1299255.1 type II secretion system protein GspM [Acetobacter sp.]MCI1315802.1 type II secretion system protein GspM [Acetobacter sp.]